MSGKIAQISFHYQNLVAILKILVALREGKLLSVKVEQKVRNSNKEIDLILEFTDGKKEFCEIKSGFQFTNDENQIKEALLSLFENYKQRPATEVATYMVIINPDFFPPMAKVAADVRRFATNKTVTDLFKAHCASWEIEEAHVQDFHGFIKLLTLDHEMKLPRVRVQVLAEIGKIADGVFLNAEHGLESEDLLNRLVEKIILSIHDNDGEVDLKEFVEIIVDWCTRNRIAAKQSIQQSDFDEEESETRTKLQEKFPSIALEIVQPTPSAAIDES